MHIILTGPSLENPTGGIAFAMPGYLECLEHSGLEHEMLITRDSDKSLGSLLPWIKTVARLPALLKKQQNTNTIVYSHAGEWFSMLREACILKIARLYGIKTAIHLHAAELDSYLKTWIGRKFVNGVIHSADVVFVLTPWWKERLRNSGVESNIQVIPNPLPQYFADITDIPHSYEAGEEIHLLCMTRLVEGKGVEKLLHAIPLLPKNIRATIAGDGKLKQSLVELASRLGVTDRVNFPGWISGPEKNDMLSSADIFCLLSERDSFGLTLVEAMSFGLPIIAMKNPITEFVGPMVDMIDKPTPELIAKHICALADNHEHRKKIGTDAQKWLTAQFAVPVVAPKIEQAFLEMVN